MRPFLRFPVVVGMVQTTVHGKALDMNADRAAIRSLDEKMVAALNARDLDRWLSFLAPDAKMMPPGAPPVEGRDAIRKLLSEFLTTPGFAVAHRLKSVDVSLGGDLAYIEYSYALTVKDPSAKPATERGKDISVFRKQLDGAWKVVIDMWSPDQPPAAA